jgi:replicative superfamily II helicase
LALKDNEPLGFVRLAELVSSNTPSETHYNNVADVLSKAIKKGNVTEKLSALTRLYASMCFELATEYRQKEFLHEIPNLPRNSLAPLNELFAESLSRRLLDMVCAYCDQRFNQALESSAFITELFSKSSPRDPDSIARFHDYIHVRNIDEIRTVTDLTLFTEQTSGWVLGREAERGVQADLETLLSNINMFDRVLATRAIPPWLFFLSKLYAQVALKNVDRLSIRTMFHRHSASLTFSSELIKQGFSLLWPTQVDSIERAISGKDILLVSETGTGKSLLGAVLIGSRRESDGLSIYAVPTRALAYQIGKDMIRLAYNGASSAVKVLTMEEDVNEDDLKSHRTIVGTYEKIEGLFREKLVRKDALGLLIIDECHNIADFGRGVTLDFLLTQLNPRFSCQRMLLSAVVPDDQASRLAHWAKADYFRGKDWRRTKAIEKIAVGNSESEIPSDPNEETLKEIQARMGEGRASGKAEAYVIPRTLKSVREGKMVLVVAESRPRVEKLAREIAGAFDLWINPPLGDVFRDVQLAERLEEGRAELYSYIDELNKSELVLPKSTQTIVKLLSKKVVFHHAGLPKTVRTTIERMIKDRVPLVVVSTTTLEAGVNFPVDTVLVKRLALTKTFKGLRNKLESTKDAALQYVLSRYESRLFSAYHNVIGRAGRPGFSETGESIAYFDTPDEASAFLDMRYRQHRLLGAGADLYAIVKLCEILQAQTNYRVELKSISKDLDISRGRFLSNLLNSVYLTNSESAELLSFLKKTWLWQVISDLPFIEEIERVFPLFIGKEIDELASMGFLKPTHHNTWELTALGSLVNRTLLSPLSAKRIEDGLRSLLTVTTRVTPNVVNSCLFNIVGLAFEMRVNPLDQVSVKSLSPTERNHERVFRSLLIPHDKWSLRIGTALEMWAHGTSVDDMIQTLSLTESDYGLLEELIPKNGAWVLQSMKLISHALPGGNKLVSDIDSLIASVSAGTDNEIAKSILSWDIEGLGRSSALYIIDKFKPQNLEALSKLGEERFVKQFSTKEDLSKKVYSQILKHA